MPNHIHGIIWIIDDIQERANPRGGQERANPRGGQERAKNFSPLRDAAAERNASNERAKNLSSHRAANPNFRSPVKTIGSIVRGFKIGVTKWARSNTDIHDVWHRGYYDHIIRNEKQLQNIRQYIINNPTNWHKR